MHNFYTDFQSSDSLPKAFVSDSDFLNAMWAYTHQNLMDLMAFLHLLQRFVFKFIFNISSSQRIFPILWMLAAVVPVFKEGKAALVNNPSPFSAPFLKYFKLSYMSTFHAI